MGSRDTYIWTSHWWNSIL